MRKGTPSRTAIKVARGIVWAGEQPDLASLLPVGAADSIRELLVAAGQLSPWQLSLYRSAGFQALGGLMESRVMPGHLLSGVLRKRWVDDAARRALADGVQQVLSVGAGLDTLCYRLAREDPSLVVELDHPATSGVKRAGLEALGLPKNMQLIGVDLARVGLVEALAGAPSWSSSRPSVIIAEGVLMYLDEAAVVAFLAAAREASGPGSHLLLTTVGRDERGVVGPGLGAVKLMLAMAGEPLRWGIARSDLEPFLSANGWSLADCPSSDELRSRYLTPTGQGARPLAHDQDFVQAIRK